MATVRFKRGVESTMPALLTGEPAFTTDTNKVFIGSNDGKLQIPTMDDLGKTGGYMVRESLTATANQTRFVLTKGTISKAEFLRVTVGGVLQDDVILTSPTSFDLPTGIGAGTKVVAEWFEIPVNFDSSRTFINVKDYGAKGDGVSDDTLAIIQAEQTAYTLYPNATLVFPYGTYVITNQIKFRCGLDASQCTFNYTGVGTAVVLGDDSSSGIVTFRKTFNLPRVIKVGRVTGWDGTSIGVKAVNLNGCNVYVTFIQDFEKGLNVYGYGQGNAYNNYFLGTLWDNHKNLVLEGDATSWVNQNQFYGGRLQQGLTKGAVLDDVNASQIDMSSTIQPNNNTFIGTSIEGENVAYYRIDMSGRYNAFYNCRFEGQNGALPRVRYRNTAYSNRIDGGYDSFKIVETFDAGALGGEIRDSIGAYVSAFNTTGQSIPTGANTAINTWTNVLGKRITYNATTGEFTPRAGRWKITATVCFAPNATGRRIAMLICAGSTRDIFEQPGNAGRASLKVEDVYKFDGTQTFLIQVQQTSGANLALETTSGYMKLQAEYLGN